MPIHWHIRYFQHSTHETMMVLVDALVVKKMLLNIFFSTFTILNRHQACDTTQAPCPPKTAGQTQGAKTVVEPKSEKPKKSVLYQAFERPAGQPIKQGCQKKKEQLWIGSY